MYPTNEEHKKNWEDLAQKIAQLKHTVKDFANNNPNNIGQLTIIGSGIESIGFTIGDDNLIKSADKVFYCVADPATVVWLRRIRPDGIRSLCFI